VRIVKAGHIAGERTVKEGRFICRTSMNSSSAAIASGRSSSSVSCALVSPVQTQPSRSRGNDGRARDLSGAHDDHAWDRALRAGGTWRVDETNVKIKGRWTDPPRMRARKSIADFRSPVHSGVVPGGIRDDGLITNADGKCHRNAGWMPVRRPKVTIMPKRAGISRTKPVPSL
jgi:hypothetical protein